MSTDRTILLGSLLAAGAAGAVSAPIGRRVGSALSGSLLPSFTDAAGGMVVLGLGIALVAFGGKHPVMQAGGLGLVAGGVVMVAGSPLATSNPLPAPVSAQVAGAEAYQTPAAAIVPPDPEPPPQMVMVDPNIIVDKNGVTWRLGPYGNHQQVGATPARSFRDRDPRRRRF